MRNQTHGFMENDFLKWFEAKTNGPLITNPKLSRFSKHTYAPFFTSIFSCLSLSVLHLPSRPWIMHPPKRKRTAWVGLEWMPSTTTWTPTSLITLSFFLSLRTMIGQSMEFFFFFFYLDLKVSNNFPVWFDTMDHSLWRYLWTGTNAFDTFCTLQDFVLLRFYPSWSPPISVENYQSDVASLIFHLCGLRCILHSVIFIFYFYNFLEYFNSKNI